MKLKPVVFVQGRYGYNNQNTTQQILLLKALQITQDPTELRRMIGVKSVADVYRTLDKIAMRKEYHEALAKNGLTFEYIADKLKTTIDNADKDGDRLKGVAILLKSIGLDKYEETSIGGGGWEETLLKLNKEAEEGKKEKVIKGVPEYDVIEPPMPEEIRKAKEKANKESKSIYE